MPEKFNLNSNTSVVHLLKDNEKTFPINTVRYYPMLSLFSLPPNAFNSDTVVIECYKRCY